jgi:nucleoside transporter
MMFFQYMLFAVWWVPLAAYLTNMHVEGTQKALILSSMAIGCMASPVIGMIADRYFASEKVLATLNFLTAVLLLFAAVVNNPVILFLTLLFAMLFHMPTWSLTSAIAMSHSPSELFPRIRVFGSIGWVVSGVCSLFTVNVLKLDFDGTNIPFFFGAGIGLLAVVTNLTLPNTPPPAKGQKGSVIDALGLRALVLMKDRNFAVFIVISFLTMIPFSMYWSYCSEFLLNQGFKYISVTMNFGQLAEMFFVLTVPFIIRKTGLRVTMIIGLVVLVVRYLAFYLGGVTVQPSFYFVGILVHGLIYGYFFLGGQIYIDKKAPSELKAQAQGFIFFVTFGLGLLAGNLISGRLIGQYSGAIDGVLSYNWNMIWAITSVMSLALSLTFMVCFRQDKKVIS